MAKRYHYTHKRQSDTMREKPADRANKTDDAEFKEPKNALFHQIVWLITVLFIVYFWLNQQVPSQPFIPYSEFKQQLNADNIEKISIKNDVITGSFRSPLNLTAGSAQTHSAFRTVLSPFDDRDLMPLLEQQKVTVDIQSQVRPFWWSLLVAMAPWLLIVGFFIYSSKVMRSSLGGGGIGGLNFGKSRARHFEAAAITQRYADVAGLDNAKRDLQEVIAYLKEPLKYRQLGAKMPKGILMMGPPGCGKTLLAKATAGEAEVPFFSVSGSEFIEMFVGVGASRVRDMFAEARKVAPALIFIDEIDSVGRTRGTGLGGGHDEREQTLNQILAEMDGFSSDEAVIVLAATNRPDVLDPALLRPGRFDRKLVLELPHREAREAILKVHTRHKPVNESVDFGAIAAVTAGFSGADLANLVNEAALRAARHNKHEIDQQDFDFARDKIVLGDESGILLSDEEKQRIAYHEAGHALVALLLPGSDPVKRITIIPHGRALGATEQLPGQERHNYTENYLKNRLCILLGGRCAESLAFSEYSSGAQDDLKQATLLARQMITQWGMGEQIGPVNLQQEEEHPFLGREMAMPRLFSEHSAELVDKELSRLIKNCEEQSSELLQSHRQQLDRLAAALIEHESIDAVAIAQLLEKTESN